MIQPRQALLVMLGSLLVAATACGASCPEIREHRHEFESRKRTTRGPDARMTIPFTLIDRVIQGEIARRPPTPIALPTERIGIPMSLSIALDRVTTHAAGSDQLGITLHLALIDPRDSERVLELEVDTAITPKLTTPKGKPPELAIALSPKDLGTIRPRTTPEGTRTLGRWLRSNLPAIARGLATDQMVQAFAQETLDFVAATVWPMAKDKVLGTAPLVDTRFAMPDLPIRDLALSSSDNSLIAHITTDLADAEPIRAGTFDQAGERLLLRLSGGTAMGLVNRSMARGEVPDRFDVHGKPAADGVWQTRVGWRGGSSPLVVYLWRVDGECKRAEVAARLGLSLQGDKVRVAVYDGRLTTLAGPAFAEAFAWLEMIFGEAVAMTFDTDAFVRFDAGSDQVQLRLAKIVLGEDDLLLDLDLGVAPR